MAFVTTESRGHKVLHVKSLVGVPFSPLSPELELCKHKSNKHLDGLNREKKEGTYGESLTSYRRNNSLYFLNQDSRHMLESSLNQLD